MKRFLILLVLFSFNAFAEPVNINKAGAQEIANSLNGIGSKKAEAIVDYRKKNGKFSSADELTNIKGIGEKTVAKNKSDIKLKG